MPLRVPHWLLLLTLIVSPTPAPADPAPDDYVYVDVLPEAIERTPPRYPLSARAKGIEGVVLVQALVSREGRVADARVTKSIPELDDAALEAVRTWRFKPASLQGEPVAVWVAVPVRFSMDGGGSSPPRPAKPIQLPPREAEPWEADLDTLRSIGRVSPSAQDFELRKRIIERARAMFRRPGIPDEARAQYDSSFKAVYDSSGMGEYRVVEHLAAAVLVAPWWALPYREIAGWERKAGHAEQERVALELYLVADPRAGDRSNVRKRLKELARAAR